MAPRSEGLLAAWLRVPPVHEDELNDWYDTEHLAQISSPAGVLRASRFRAEDDDGWYLATYDLEQPDVYFGEPFQQQLRNPTPWSRRMARLYGRDRIVNVYRKILQIGEDPAETSPFIFFVRMDVDADFEDAFHDWYNREHAPRLAAVPGCRRVRRFEVVQGAPRFAAIYDLDSPDVLEGPEWLSAREYGRTAEARRHMSNLRKTVLRARSCTIAV